MNRRRCAPPLLASLAGWVAVASTMIPATVMAATEHDEGLVWFSPVLGNEGKTGIVWLLLNFAVLAWILNRLLFTPLRQQQARRHEEIKQQLASATAARNEAETLVRQFRERLERLDEEVEEILDDAKRRAEADRTALIESAQRDAERIRKVALEAAERDAELRKRQIEDEVIDRAVTRAEALLRTRLGPSEQQRMVADYVGQLESLELGRLSSARGVES